jgi:exonuclease SbcD
MGVARLLLLADTHLGLDWPARARVSRRRRGPDFFAAFERALEPARLREVDCVVHGGDLLYRSQVSARLVHSAFEPLRQVADRGVPVYLVPGNHERSAVPRGLIATHPLFFVFDRPRTYVRQLGGLELALAGFPHARVRVRQAFPRLVGQTGWRTTPAEGHLLCIHQCLEGATVGPANFTFRASEDVVAGADIPRGLAAVLTGHIHRHQVLERDLRGQPLAAPVLYPGSTERTSFAERDEPKGYVILELESRCGGGAALGSWRFHPLPTRPMVQLELKAARKNTDDLRATIRTLLAGLSPEAVVRLRLQGPVPEEARGVLSAASLRALAPATMNLSLANHPCRPAGGAGPS